MDQLKFFDREIKRTQERLCDLDDLRAALRTKSESGTTGCSDAGGGDTPSKPGRSADWQACWGQLVAIMANRRKQIVDAIDDGMCHLPNKAVAEEYRILLEKANAIEAAAK